LQLRQPLALGIALAVSACSETYPPEPETYSQSPAPSQAIPPVDGNTPLPSPLPEIVAKVNGHPIPLRNVQIIAEQSLRGAVPKDQRPLAYRMALEQVIVRELLFQEAVARGVEPDTAAIDQAYNEARVSYKDDDAWAAFLAQQAMDPMSFRAELRIQHTVQTLMRQHVSSVPSVSDDEVRSFYDDNPQLFETGERLRASHILIRVQEGIGAVRRQQLKEEAERLLAEIRAGADFGALAREHSGDPGSAGKGGELQVFGKGQMVPAFEQAAYALEEGELSDVVESPFGYHIIKLHARMPSEKLAFEDVKDAARARILGQRQQQKLQELVASLRAKARIQTFL
jgi:peptidyl-prolyl cis-trans isomerase C